MALAIFSFRAPALNSMHLHVNPSAARMGAAKEETTTMIRLLGIEVYDEWGDGCWRRLDTLFTAAMT
jgi:hypothetical protein